MFNILIESTIIAKIDTNRYRFIELGESLKRRCQKLDLNQDQLTSSPDVASALEEKLR